MTKQEYTRRQRLLAERQQALARYATTNDRHAYEVAMGITLRLAKLPILSIGDRRHAATTR